MGAIDRRWGRHTIHYGCVEVALTERSAAIKVALTSGVRWRSIENLLSPLDRNP